MKDWVVPFESGSSMHEMKSRMREKTDNFRTREYFLKGQMVPYIGDPEGRRQDIATLNSSHF